MNDREIGAHRFVDRADLEELADAIMKRAMEAHRRTLPYSARTVSVILGDVSREVRGLGVYPKPPEPQFVKKSGF